MGGGLAALVVLELLGFDLSPLAEAGRLKNPLTMFIALMFSIGITAVAGAVLGFWFVPAARAVSNAQLLLAGAIFGLLAYGLFVPTLGFFGVYFGAVAYVAAAAAAAFIAGRIFGRSREKPR